MILTNETSVGRLTSKRKLSMESEARQDVGLWGTVILALPGYGKIVPGVFTPVLAKHSKSFSLIDCISVGVDRMQRNFEPMRRQVEAWQRSELTDVTAKVVIYEAFVEGRLEAPRHLSRPAHDLYFEPSTRIFGRARSGVFRTRSPPRSRNWSRFPNLRQRRSSVNSWRRGFRNRSD